MQNSKQTENRSHSIATSIRALGLIVLALGLQACQTTPLTADQWQARTAAVNAFSNAANAYSENSRPRYQPYQPIQYQQPVYIYQAQPQTYQPAPEAPLFGEGSLFGQ